MPDIVVNTDNFNLTSGWKCKETNITYGSGGRTSKWKFDYITTGSTTIEFKFNLPSGAKVINSGIYAEINSPNTGISILTMNGIRAIDVNGKKFFGIGSNVGNGSYKAEFKFKANGQIQRNRNYHSSTISFSNVFLHIVYEDPTPPTPPAPPPDESELFHVPPQGACIYNQETGGIYLFDGVVKIQHSFTSKIEEEPDKHKEEYVNNARNEPDKLTLDVIMSDVYTDEGNMTNAPGWDESSQETAFNASKGYAQIQESDGVWSRSGNAVYVLHRLKEARTLLSIVTPQYVHVDMIIAGITVNQDAETPCGWQGQIEFRHKYKVAEKKNTNSKPRNTGNNDNPGQESNSSNIFGDLWNGVKSFFGISPQ